MSLAEIEHELINRGYRILYRRPDDWDITTYQVAKDGWTGGFRITEQVADEARADDIIDRAQRHYGWPK